MTLQWGAAFSLPHSGIIPSPFCPFRTTSPSMALAPSSPLRSADRVVQQRAAMALARMAPEGKLRAIFVDKRGLDVLLDMLVDESLDQRIQVLGELLGG